MTPTDELWIDMAQFDTEVADGIWDGAVPPDDAPAWWGEVASLARAARGPATSDELAAEDAVIARMTEAILEAAAEDAATAATPAAVPGPAPAGADAADEGADVAAVPARPGDHPRLSLVVMPAVDEAGDRPVTPDPLDAHTAAGPGGAAPATVPPATVPPAAEFPAPPAAGASAPTGPPSAPSPAVTPPTAAPAAARPVPDDGRPRHLKAAPADAEPGGLRLVRRLVAVKAVATTTAVAIGITAAAAATGVVVTVVDPPRRQAPATTVSSTGTTLEIEVPVVDQGSVVAREGRSTPVHQLTCVLDFGCPDPDAVLGQPVPAAEDGVMVITTTTVPGGPTTTVPRSPATSLPTATTVTTVAPTETTVSTTSTTGTTSTTTATTSTTAASTTTTQPTTTTTASSPGGATTLSVAEDG